MGVDYCFRVSVKTISGTFVAEGKCVMRDGTVIKTRRRWLFSEVQKDLLEVRFTEGIDNGAPLPDGFGVFERIAK